MASRRHDDSDGAPEGRAGRIDFYCERGITALLLVILVYSVLAWGAVRQTEFALVQGATVLILGLWTIRVWINRRLRLFWPPICWGVLAFAAYAIFRCHYVEIAYPARQEFNQVLVYGALFLAVANNVNRRDYTTLIGMTLIALASVLAILAIIQFTGHTPPRIWGAYRAANYGTRGSGTFINPDNFSAFLELVAPIALAYALMGRLKPATKVLLIYAVFLLVAGICASVSRAGVITAGITFILFLIALIFQPGYRVRAAVILFVVLVAGGIAISKVGTLQRRFNTAGLDTGLRFHMWNMAYQLYQRSPVLGIGPGHYDHKFWPYNNKAALLPMHPVHAHNDYVQTLCEWGAVGVILVGGNMVLLAWGIRRTWAFVKRDPSELGSRNSSKAAFVFGTSFGLLAIMIHSITDFHMHIPAIALCVITLMAQLTVQLRFATEGFWVNPRLAGRCVLTLAALAASVCIVLEAQHGFRESYWLNRANAERGWTQTYLGYLQNAYAVDATNPKTLFDIGDCLRCMGDAAQPENPDLYKQALDWLDRAGKIDPFNPNIPMRYATCLDSMGKTNESLPYYDQACAMNPGGYVELMYKGRHYMIQENYPAALDAFRASLKHYYTTNCDNLLYTVLDRMARQPGKPRH